MSKLDSLQDSLATIRLRIKGCQTEHASIKRSLTNIETALIEAREKERQLLEHIGKIQAEQVDIDSLDDERQKEIDEFKTRLPNIMRRELYRHFWRISHTYLTRGLTSRRRGL